MEAKDLRECLELQLSEFQMMQAMYAGEEELVLTDPGTLADIEECINGCCAFSGGSGNSNNAHDIPLSSRLEYTINIVANQGKVALAVSLPFSYPKSKPQVSVYCDGYSRLWHEKLREGLDSYVNEIEEGSLCIGMIVAWVQEKLNETTEPEQASLSEKMLAPEEVECSRYWIYSHHIYSSTKRKNILAWAQDYDITGFCLPGKPGIICMEGTERNCFDMWQKIRAMNWQKILIKHKETKLCADVYQERRFKEFTEVAFAGGIERHMNMAGFREYLLEHESEYMFKMYFGIDYKEKK